MNNDDEDEDYDHGHGQSQTEIERVRQVTVSTIAFCKVSAYDIM